MPPDPLNSLRSQPTTKTKWLSRACRLAFGIISIKSQAESSMMRRRTCWASTTSNREHEKKQSKHDVVCLFYFFLNQHCQNHGQKQETVSKRKQEIIAKTSPINLLIFTRAFFLAVNALQRSPTQAIIRYSQSPVLGPLSYLLRTSFSLCPGWVTAAPDSHSCGAK